MNPEPPVPTPSLRTVYRFVNDVSGEDSPDFKSPKARLRPQDLQCRLETGETIQEQLKRVEQLDLATVANMTAGGELPLTSPMLPVLENPERALQSTFMEGGDPGLRTLILHCAAHMVTFRIPNDLVYEPFTYAIETELMVLADSIWRFHTEIQPNPFKLKKA
jgi:hypothetical protein